MSYELTENDAETLKDAHDALRAVEAYLYHIDAAAMVEENPDEDTGGLPSSYSPLLRKVWAATLPLQELINGLDGRVLIADDEVSGMEPVYEIYDALDEPWDDSSWLAERTEPEAQRVVDLISLKERYKSEPPLPPKEQDFFEAVVDALLKNAMEEAKAGVPYR